MTELAKSLTSPSLSPYQKVLIAWNLMNSYEVKEDQKTFYSFLNTALKSNEFKEALRVDPDIRKAVESNIKTIIETEGFKGLEFMMRLDLDLARQYKVHFDSGLDSQIQKLVAVSEEEFLQRINSIIEIRNYLLSKKESTLLSVLEEFIADNWKKVEQFMGFENKVDFYNQFAGVAGLRDSKSKFLALYLRNLN